MLRRLQGIEPEKKPKKVDKNGSDANEILNNVKQIQNISNEVENKIKNIQNNEMKKKVNKTEPHNPPPSYNNPPPQNYGGHGGYGGGGGRVNPMNLINDAINNHPANDKMIGKYGHLAGGNPKPNNNRNYPGNKGGNNNNKDNKNKKGQNGKSDFLLSRYPDGNGPDSELIEMLEREVVDTDPHVQFDDIAELEQAKQAIKEAVLLPLVVPGFFKGIRRPWKGVLLYGPPGTGKTMLAKAVASKGETTFFNVHSSSFASKWRGESEKLVRILFEMAKYYAPTVIFIDEIDSLCSQRGTGNEGEGSRRVKAEMLVQMDGANTSSSAGANEKSKEEQKKLVTVMGATNRPWDLDEALRRRFEKRIYIPLPNEKGRQALFRLNTKKIELGKDINSPKLIEMSKGYSGADISNVCREAALMPLRRELKANKGKDLEQLVKDKEFRTKINAPITMSDFEEALSHIGKSVSEKDLEQYAEWTKQFSSV